MAQIRGDPHFTTFDGKDFIFNSFGTYTLMEAATSLTGAEPSADDFAAQVTYCDGLERQIEQILTRRL